MKNSIIILFVLFFSACSNKQDIEFKQPKMAVSKKTPTIRTNKGSLYAIEGASLFADKKDLQIGDIIQIKIDEGLKSNSKNKRELSENRNSKLGGGLSTPKDGLNKLINPISKNFNSTFGVDVSTQSSSSNKGEVKTQFDEAFKTVISAVIEETYANGNYYIKGSKELLIDGQKQTVIISGVIRPYDINSDNSVDSSKMANLKLMYKKEGEEADALKTPWGIQILKSIWPF